MYRSNLNDFFLIERKLRLTWSLLAERKRMILDKFRKGTKKNQNLKRLRV